MMVMHGRLAEGGGVDVVGAFCTIADNLITFLHHLTTCPLYHSRPRNLTFPHTNYFLDGVTAHGLCNAMGHFRKEWGECVLQL